jgi:hypothetical protein
MIKQPYVVRVMHDQPAELRDPEMSNRKRVFTEAMQEKPSEILIKNGFHEVLSSRLRNKKFMAAFQKNGQMGTEEKIAHLGKHRTDYPGAAINFTAERRPAWCYGGADAYWIELEKNGAYPEDARRIYSTVIIAEAKGIAIAKKGTFKLRFSDTLIQLANALDFVAPNSTINLNYHLSREDGKPSEIAEILLYGSDGGIYGTLKICLGDISQVGKGGLGRKDEISGTLFLALEGNAMKPDKKIASTSKTRKFLDARFNQMEGLMREIAPQGIADGLEIYRCLKQVQL